MIPSYECVRVRVDGPTGTLQLNRPSVLNACNEQLMNDVIAAAAWFNRQEQVKVVVVSGAGAAFCTGFDLRAFQNNSAERVRSAVDLGLRMVEAVSSMNAVTIAAIHGHCIGGGVVLACACDFRYAAAGTQFHLPETELGVPLAWGGMPWLVREVGPAMAMEFALLCRKVGAERMKDSGFLNGVVEGGELDSHVSAMAAELGKRSSLVLRITKKQVIAAKNQLATTSYAFLDAHVFFSALSDEESVASREAYISAKLPAGARAGG